jgi:DNA replication and repair protein RecF
MALARRAPGADTDIAASPKGAWIERLQLTNFRNYRALTLSVGPGPVVLTGANGSGKTNLLEAVSLITSGQGLRRAPYPELARIGGTAWAVAARLNTPSGPVDIGTGLTEGAQGGVGSAPGVGRGSGRVVRIDGHTHSGSGALAEHVEMVWLIPAMDGLFTGPASERRRFLDRLISGLHPSYRSLLGQFERATQQRNRLLADDVRDSSRFEPFERVMAEAGVAIAAVRAGAVAELVAAVNARRDAGGDSLFPWAELAVVGTLETALAERPAVEVEDSYCAQLAADRERDRAAGRALEGPHRSDLAVGHGPKELPAKVCSTGEQKALLIGLLLAHCDAIAQRQDGAMPILILDEITAHLDPLRRAALFDEIVAMGTQAWMSGTDQEAFASLSGRGQCFRVEEGWATPSLQPRHGP